jgi:hypothetical protein
MLLGCAIRPTRLNRRQPSGRITRVAPITPLIWPGGGPSHVFVLLSEFPEYRAYARAHHELLSQYAVQLGVIPEEWLHSTVQFPVKSAC